MRAVCNATPLIHLAKIGRLELLPKTFGQVHIPPAVYHEVVEQGSGWVDAQAVQNAIAQGWLKVEPIQVGLVTLIADLTVYLGPGEAEAIAMACELGPDYLILDERAGRLRAIKTPVFNSERRLQESKVVPKEVAMELVNNLHQAPRQLRAGQMLRRDGLVDWNQNLLYRYKKVTNGKWANESRLKWLRLRFNEVPLATQTFH